MTTICKLPHYKKSYCNMPLILMRLLYQQDMIFNIKNWFYISGLFLVLTESADTIVIRSLDRYANEPSCSNTIAYVRQHEPDLLYVHEADVSSICGLGSGNCCRSKVEKRLLFRTYQNVTNCVTKIKHYMREDVKNYDTLLGAYEYTVERSKQEYTNYFLSTFGLHYYKHTVPAEKMFKYFKDFIFVQNTDLLPAELHDFFADLFVTSAKEFLYLDEVSPSYQQCIRSVYRRYEHFAEYNQLFLSLNSTLTRLSLVLRARESLQQFVNHISTDSSLFSAGQCPTSLMKMSTCQLCDGYSSLPPCRDLCLNTVGDCLAPLLRLRDPLLYQYRILKQLVTQFEEDFEDFEKELKQLRITAMEFIIRLHANARKIVTQIKNKCAVERSSRAKRTAAEDRPSDWKSSSSHQWYSSQPSGTLHLATALKQFLLSHDRVISFLHDLPNKLCRSLGVASGNSNCWNGQEKGKYELGTAIATKPNSFLTFQADYERVKTVTYSLQAFVQFQACYSDDIQCLSSLPSCDSHSTGPATELISDLAASGVSGDGVNALDDESEAGGADASSEEREELDYSGEDSGISEDTSHRKNRYYFKIARNMPDTVATCLSSAFDLSHLLTAQHEPSTTAPEDATDWEREFTLLIETDNSTLSTNSGIRNASISLLLLLVIVCILTLF